MEIHELSNFMSQALYLVLLLSMPTILAAAIVGTLFSLFQALTQIQEQTLSFAIKLIAVVIVIALTARWTSGELLRYTESVFELFPKIGH